MGFLGSLLGVGDAVTGVVDKVASGLDKLTYTDQEKADAAGKERAAARAALVQWMAQTKGQNVARRCIALSIVAVWLLAKVSATVSYIAAEPGAGDRLTALADSMSGEMMLVLAFYFAAPHMSEFIGPVVNRLNGKAKKNSD